MPSTGIRIAFWTIAVLLGGAQTWFTRHRIFSDGISYLAIARQYASGDWHGALNAYWSPLYSWLIAAYLVVVHPSPYWEAAALHVVNYAAFLASCFVFERFVFELIRLRPESLRGLSARTLVIAGYVAILHAGLIMTGLAPVCPDMAAFFLIGVAAWLMARMGAGMAGTIQYAALGATLGLAYLDRAAFAPLSAVYLVAAAVWLTRKHSQVLVCAVCLLAVAAPFAMMISMKRGSFTLGESGKLNYGWEVNRAARWTHWQGEPGDIGTPVHPTRLILREPVPVYAFAEPVGGSYPPWYDPSYWYEGIHPHFDAGRQSSIFLSNAALTLFYSASSPIFWVLVLLMTATFGKAIQPWRWPAGYWALAVPMAAGIALYCLVYSEKRYIAGFFLVLTMTVLAGVWVPDERMRGLANVAVQGVCALFAAVMVAWLAPQVRLAAGDLAHGREAESNVSYILAHRFQELGLKPGDRVAYVGDGFEADWVRLMKAKIVAEVPVVHNRGAGIRRAEETNYKYPRRFFELDESAREPVYAAFRQAGAVIAVADHLPPNRTTNEWKSVLDQSDPDFPKGPGQISLQVPLYYHWLNARNSGFGS